MIIPHSFGCTITLIGLNNAILYAAWNSAGTRIVTTSNDGTAKVWDTKTGNELFTFSDHTNSITKAAWSPDDMRIVTASWDGTARIYFANLAGPGGLIEYACGRVGGNLTREEWGDYLGDEVPYRKTCPDLNIRKK